MTTLYKERRMDTMNNPDEISSSDTVKRQPNTNPQIQKKGLKWYIWLLIVIVIIAAIGGTIYAIIPKKSNCEKEGNCQPKKPTEPIKSIGGNNNGDEESQENESGGNENSGTGNDESGGEGIKNDDDEGEEMDEAEIKEAFESNFKINSNIGSLSQIEMILKKNSVSKTDNLEDLIFIKGKLDLYIINETTPKNNDYYSKEYCSVITIHSFCSEIGKTDCELSDYLDLTYKETNNLRAVTDESELSELLLPICIIKHTETNLIISLTCPKRLE